MPESKSDEKDRDNDVLIPMANVEFQKYQIKWMNTLMNNHELLDAKFCIGKEKEIMYGMRSLLSNISDVFKKQFNGNFQESSLDAMIEYPTVTPNAFKCILRASFCLDPGINADKLITCMYIYIHLIYKYMFLCLMCFYIYVSILDIIYVQCY